MKLRTILGASLILIGGMITGAIAQMANDRIREPPGLKITYLLTCNGETREITDAEADGYRN